MSEQPETETRYIPGDVVTVTLGETTAQGTVTVSIYHMPGQPSEYDVYVEDMQATVRVGPDQLTTD